ncbi:FAD-dependent oxidoreductase [Kineococcus sp. SYSU DK005]|uniref:FAD-dependent oxidoreductase n=1 Tax=Kineococcus sp. SYSU DK005 TaxID=3383126 RepID=UPI003D7DB600
MRAGTGDEDDGGDRGDRDDPPGAGAGGAAGELPCVVAGGGPAGVVLGLLLARAGVRVLVLEKHEDFLRDFRGDTVHPSTLRLLDELGLAEEFLRLPHARVERASATTDDGTFTVADFSRLPGRFPFLALVPQWDFLDLLASSARRHPGFELRTGARVLGLLHEGGRVAGLRYRAADGAEHEVRAALTVAADGRGSVLRAAAGLPLRVFGVGVDVLWFRLPRPAGAVPPTGARLSAGRFAVVLDRGTHLQCAYVVPAGGLEAVRERGLSAFRADVARLLPDLAGVVGHLTSTGDLHVLRVRVDRLRRWHRDGLLVVGDAAHAMSPVGGVGVNLAVQDAVAAARLLAGPLRRGRPSPRELARVRRRRWLPVALTQAAQRVAHRRVLEASLGREGPVRAPAVLRLLQRVPVLQVLPAAAIGLGVLTEHPPPEHPPPEHPPPGAPPAGDVALDTSAMYR